MEIKWNGRVLEAGRKENPGKEDLKLCQDSISAKKLTIELLEKKLLAMIFEN